jgi:hypothetical protein
MTTSNIPPTCLAMLMCEHILRDPENGKYFLLGTTHHTMAPRFPARYPRMWIYAAITGIHESAELSLNVILADSNKKEDVQVAQFNGRLEAPNPLVVAELTLQLRNLTFPQAGEYRFQLNAGGSLLSERRFMVRQAPAQPPGGQGGPGGPGGAGGGPGGSPRLPDEWPLPPGGNPPGQPPSGGPQG